jgi:hypothetical protein
MTSSYILWNIFLSLVGAGYIIYGKKVQKAVPIIGGILLLVLPYFTSNSMVYMLVVLVVIGFSYFLSF